MLLKIKKLNYAAIFSLLPVFWFVPVPYYFAYCYFSFCLLLIFFSLRNNPVFRFEPDPFLFWLIGCFALAFTLDLANGARSLLLTTHLLFDFAAIAIVLLYEPNEDDLLVLTLVGLLTLHVGYWIREIPFQNMQYIKHHTTTAYCGAVALAMAYLRRYKSALFVLLASYMFFTRATWLGLLVALPPWYLFKNFRLPEVARKGTLALLVIGVAGTSIVIAQYYPYNRKLLWITHVRSYYYQIVWDEFFSRGIGMIFPVSNTISTEVLSADLRQKRWLSAKDPEFRADAALFYENTPAPSVHSTYLEFLSNYGIPITVIVFVSFLFLETQWTWPLLAFFLIDIGYHGGVFAPNFIVPFYITYRTLYRRGRLAEK